MYCRRLVQGTTSATWGKVGGPVMGGEPTISFFCKSLADPRVPKLNSPHTFAVFVIAHKRK